MLLILAVVLIVFLGAATLILNATGAPMWNSQISRNAKLIWGLGFGIALAIAALWLGPAILATWPYWVGVLVFTVAVFKLADRLSGVGGKKQPRSLRARPIAQIPIEQYFANPEIVTHYAAQGYGVHVVDAGRPVIYITGPRDDSAAWR